MDNILCKLNELIDSIKRKYGYGIEDFVKIIHIVDTDGVFCDENVIKEEDVEGVQYYTDHIETKYPEYLIKKHRKKADILFKLYSTGKINGVSYKVYFNSCNLEHVLFGELKDFTDDEKEEMADEFAEHYENKVDEFINFISGIDIAVSGTYKETWHYMERDKHSLERHSNMHLIFK